MSPCSHTGGPSHVGAHRASSHAAVTARVSTIPRARSIQRRVSWSRVASGTPRPKLAALGTGPPVGSTARSAATNPARSAAARPLSRGAVVASSPGIQDTTDHAHG